MTDLWAALRGHRPQFVLIVCLEAMTSGLEAVLHPLLIKALFDQAVLATDFSRFAVLGSLYLLLGLTLNIGGYWIAWWRKRCENACVLAMELELLDRAIGLDSRRISESGNAAFVSRVHNDVKEGVLPAIDVTVQIARQAIASVAFVGVLLYLSWQASLILFVIVPPLMLVSNRLAKKIEANTDPEREAEARYVDVLTRSLQAYHALRGLTLLMPGTRAANKRALGKFLDIVFDNNRLTQKQRTLSDLIMNVCDTASLIVGAYFVFAGRLTFGGFLAFVNSLWRAATGIFQLVNLIPQLRRNSAILRRIEVLRTSSPTPYHDDAAVVLVHGARVVHADGTEVAIDDFTLTAGEHVLLRGPNGCGKTTLLHIVSGTLAPDAGVVTRPARVASLTAPVQLPPLPVRELVPDETLRTTLGLAELTDRLPSDLSSGQRQKVGVGALLTEEADVYLADEPFANLDDETRELVWPRWRSEPAAVAC
jgi:ATP-binding cassette subfamily B protein